MDPLLMIVLDGWGHGAPSEHNAIFQAHTPNWDTWWSTRPHALLSGSGLDVGLPKGQMGNSEVGHMHLGAGRIVPQALDTISQAIAQDGLRQHAVLKKAFIKKNTVHLIALLSPGGVHSHSQHIEAMITCAHQKGVEKLTVHAILDGRDTPPQSAKASIQSLQALLKDKPGYHIGSLCGRYYAMDRDHRWQRIEKAYQLFTEKKGLMFDEPLSALSAAYERGETDEFVSPSWCTPTCAPMTPRDTILCVNFRADRMRQLCQALLTPKNVPLTSAAERFEHTITLTEYDQAFDCDVLFPPNIPQDTLGEVIAQHGGSQLRIAETEKYAHVTYFFNGGVETPFAKEDRQLIPSPQVEHYDEKPAMSAHEVTQQLVQFLNKKQHDFILCNFANADMVGHTGNFQATLKAIETLDSCLGQLVQASKKHRYQILITADHGNAEMMFDEHTGQAHTAHTINPVPLLHLGAEVQQITEFGSLIDVAPTVLKLMGLEPPQAMTGQFLFRR